KPPGPRLRKLCKRGVASESPGAGVGEAEPGLSERGRGVLALCVVFRSKIMCALKKGRNSVVFHRAITSTATAARAAATTVPTICSMWLNGVAAWLRRVGEERGR